MKALVIFRCGERVVGIPFDVTASDSLNYEQISQLVTVADYELAYPFRDRLDPKATEEDVK